MGITKLSEKCQKCNRKDTCDDKRMEACAYVIHTIPSFAQGGIVSSEVTFGSYNPNVTDEVVIKIDFEPSENLIDTLQKAIKQRERRCAFRGVI